MPLYLILPLTENEITLFVFLTLFVIKETSVVFMPSPFSSTVSGEIKYGCSVSALDKKNGDVSYSLNVTFVVSSDCTFGGR